MSQVYRYHNYLVAFIYSSPGIPFQVEVTVAGGTGEKAVLENTHGRWKPCQTHAFEAVKTSLGEDARSQLSTWTERRLEARPKPRPLGLYTEDDEEFKEADGFQDFDKIGSEST